MLPFAVRTGLEPATPGVTGRYSNQLNYRTIVQAMFEPMEGIEPTTPRLQITCSGQLSYIGKIVTFFQRGCKGMKFSDTSNILLITFANLLSLQAFPATLFIFYVECLNNVVSHIDSWQQAPWSCGD